MTEKGTCDRAYRYPVRISNGSVGYAGEASFNVTGRVGANGAVTVTVSRGNQSATGSGRMSVERRLRPLGAPLPANAPAPGPPSAAPKSLPRPRLSLDLSLQPPNLSPAHAGLFFVRSTIAARCGTGSRNRSCSGRAGSVRRAAPGPPARLRSRCIRRCANRSWHGSDAARCRSGAWGRRILSQTGPGSGRGLIEVEDDDAHESNYTPQKTYCNEYF